MKYQKYHEKCRIAAVQAANGFRSQIEFRNQEGLLKKELIRIGETTTFITTKLLNGTFQDIEFEISFDESPQHTHSLR